MSLRDDRNNAVTCKKGPSEASGFSIGGLVLAMREQSQSQLHLRSLFVVVGLYIVLRFWWTDLGQWVLAPVNLLVTFLHELGHACGVVLTGGTVDGVEIHYRGSGVTRYHGGSRSIITILGYVGSAVMGNLMFSIGVKAKRIAPLCVAILACVMVFVGFVWYSSMFSTLFLLAFASVLLIICFYTSYDRQVLMFLGLATTLYIIQDFDVGPSSDLKAYAEVMGFLSASTWKYVWLTIVLALSAANIYWLITTASKQSSDTKYSSIIAKI